LLVLLLPLFRRCRAAYARVEQAQQGLALSARHALALPATWHWHSELPASRCLQDTLAKFTDYPLSNFQNFPSWLDPQATLALAKASRE